MKSLKSTTLILLATAALSVVASGCSSKEPGNATTQPPASTTVETTSSSESSSSGPDLDLSKVASDPCQLLKPNQLSQLGTFDAPKKRDAPLGPSCRWAAKDVVKGAGYSVTLSTKGNTFEAMKENAKSGPVFKETTISGYSAYNSDITDGKGNCATTVRTSSKDAVAVAIVTENEDAPEYKDACAFAEKAAVLVVQSLKG